MSKRRRYTDEFRASAVVMLEAAGYPDKKGALQQTADSLDMPASTLHGWYNETRNPPPSELRSEKKMELADLLRNEIDAALGQAPEVRHNANYKDLITGAAIMIDKLQLLTGKPTERVENVDSPREELARRLDSLIARNGATKTHSHVNGSGS